jgi:hypothetical protein
VYDPLAKAPRKSPFEGKYTPLGACCILLTWTQRTPDWFLLRKFRITSSIASAILRCLFRQVERDRETAMREQRQPPPVNTSLVEIFQFINVGNSNFMQLLGVDLELEEPFDLSDETEQSLQSSKFTCAQLREFCRQRGLKLSGNKAELALRLASLDVTSTQSQQPNSPGDNIF